VRHQLKGWDQPGTARDFDIFARSCPLYSEMASNLTLRCVTGRERTLVDLGAGTGVNTAAIVVRMHPEARLWAVEPSEVMLSKARRHVLDPRVRWLVGDSAVLRELKGGAWVDVCLANASAYMDLEPDRLLKRVAEMLKPGGIFGCTIRAEYLGEIHHLITPEARAFAEVLDSIRHAAESRNNGVCEAREAPTGGNFPATCDALSERLRGLGFRQVVFERDDTIMTAEDRARWYALPPIRDAWIPHASESAKAAAVRELFARTRALPPLRMCWISVWAKKGE
jgi:SAM-dependent methyltransferase